MGVIVTIVTDESGVCMVRPWPGHSWGPPQASEPQQHISPLIIYSMFNQRLVPHKTHTLGLRDNLVDSLK